MKKKRMTNADLLKKIEALEREVAELKARPVNHHHYYPQPQSQPFVQPYVAPQWPEPMHPRYPVIWCTTSNGAGDVTLSMNNDGEATGGVVAKVA